MKDMDKDIRERNLLNEISSEDISLNIEKQENRHVKETKDSSP